MVGRILKAVLIVLSVYLCCVVGLFVYLLFKYGLVDLGMIEPTAYEPDARQVVDDIHHLRGLPPGDYGPRGGLLFGLNSPDVRTQINRLGARNLFEVTAETKNTVVLLGDSMVFGYGLNDRQTVSYHLNQIDRQRRYINLALSGYNINDSVARYLYIREQIRPPLAIVLQILWDNDLGAAAQMEERAREAIKRDARYILFPLAYFVDETRLFTFHMGCVWKGIYEDLSAERFYRYVRKPLDKLRTHASRDGSRLMILSYDDTSVSWQQRFIKPDTLLKSYCDDNHLGYFRLSELLDEKHFDDRLPDGHPSSALNNALAARIKKILDGTSPRP